MTSPFSFQLKHVDAHCGARLATLVTPHGAVDLPAFMPVGTLGTVKALEIEHVRQTGAQMVLANTYHLALRPGHEVVQALGGLHEFMGWNGPILTDSGGFQLFSLAANVKITEERAVFRSHIDGRQLSLSPEESVAIQEALGSDIAMVLDHVIALPAEPSAIQDANERTIRWAARCKAAATRTDQVQFAIIQGGLDRERRLYCAEKLAEMDFPGYAVGGLSVGEAPADMYAVLDYTTLAMPVDRPRYLMGVGRPQDLLEAVRRGIDMFDCVMPTRNGRNALAFTDRCSVRVRNLKYQTEKGPLEEGCPCPACKRSLGYLRHLFMANEMLGPMLLSAHNLTYYQRLLAGARNAIAEDRFEQYRMEKMRSWGEVV